MTPKKRWERITITVGDFLEPDKNNKMVNRTFHHRIISYTDKACRRAAVLHVAQEVLRTKGLLMLDQPGGVIFKLGLGRTYIKAATVSYLPIEKPATAEETPESLFDTEQAA